MTALDTWAVISFLQAGPGGAAVRDELPRRPWMSWINLGEVLYILTRRQGVDRAQEIIRELHRTLRVELPDEALVRSAAAIKAAHRMSYADAFAAATALAHDAELWTGDDELLGEGVPWRARDLRT